MDKQVHGGYKYCKEMVRDSAARLNAADSGVESVVGGFPLGLGAQAGPGRAELGLGALAGGLGLNGLEIISSLKLPPTDEPTVPVICFPWAVSVGI